MSEEKFTAPSREAMTALLPAFEFSDIIASNDLGAVYFANQRSLDRQVAIKVFSPKLGNDAAFVKSFENASRVMAGMRHPNLIGLLDSGRAGDMPYQVMEFVPGKSLARSTRGQVVEFGQSMALLDTICEGIAHAHENGLVHGNLDTLSILLNQNALPKIGSFGLDRTVHTDAAADVQTQCIAPEVLSKSWPASGRSDVYSLGAIFYELITGAPYEPDAAPASTLSRCRKEIDTVLKQATAINPAERTADVRSFHAALKKAADPGLGSSAGAAARPPAAPAVAPSMQKPAAGGFDSKLLLKIAIIIALLFAIKFTWTTMKKANADRVKENLEIIAKGERAKKEARELAEQMRQSDLETLAAKKQAETVVPDYVPEVESPEVSLARLKSSLASGGRSEMPFGSVRKGDSDYFLVSEPMAWAEAAWFAEQHGGHLAMPDTDLAWLTDEVTKGKTCWLGAARSGAEAWVLADGTPWNQGSPPSGSGAYLTVGRGGEFSAADDITPLPFVIQWRIDGSNPATLAATLAATRSSLNGASPVYPPGTVASGSRHYLFVPRPATWKKAGEFAENGGGHLIVPSDNEEIGKLDGLTKRIKADGAIWLGGSLEGDIWKWATGEPWIAAKWAANADAGDEGSAIVIRPGKGWDAMTRDEEASGFIIEWSDDRKAAKTGSTAYVGDAAAELSARVKALLTQASAKREEEHTANIKKFRWDLDSYMRNLNKGNQLQFGPSVETLKEHVADNRLKVAKLRGMAQDAEILVTPEMLKLITYHSNKQEEIVTLFAGDAAKIRDAFVEKLAGIRDEAEAAGQSKIHTDSGELMEGAKDLDAWVGSYGLILKPVPVEDEEDEDK
jgi:serine/threonine protein kinase